jgi:hypothetical protein
MRAAARPSPEILAAALSALRARFGERLAEGEAIRQQHGNQLSEVPNQPPDAVLFPDNTAEVCEAVRVCAKHKIPIIPFGVGSSFEGHINAPFGGLSIDMSRMKRVVALNASDLDCTVEAGVTRTELNNHLRTTGLFFPIDPGADASLGGMAATRASGTNAVRYGTMRDNVLALTIVLPDGSTSRTGTRARKSSAGYDLTRLIVGSEGTLAVITEITLKLSAFLKKLQAVFVRFPPSGRPAMPSSQRFKPAFRSPVSSCWTSCKSKPATPIRASTCRRGRCCFWSFTAPAAVSPSSPGVLTRSRPSSAADHLIGQRDPKTVHVFGGRGMMPTGRGAHFAQQQKAFPRTFACRYRSLPPASQKPKPTSPKAD